MEEERRPVGLTNAKGAAMIVVDRIEGDRALVEFEGEVIEIPARALPAGCGEGSVLRFERQDDEALLAEGRARIARLSAKNDLPDDIEL
jgi:hypothetical protein